MLGYARRMAGTFRLFLALLVVNEHITGFVNFGGYAVNTFFILSGFWVARMWTGKYQRFARPAATFWLSRLWRIYPAFLVVLAAVALLRGKLPPLAAANPLSAAVWDWVPPAWSLGPELQFYALAPFVVALFRRKDVAAGLLALLAASTVATIFLGARGFATYALFFVIGCAAAMQDWAPPRRLALACFAVCVAVVLVAWLVPALHPVFYNVANKDGYAVHGGAALAAIGAPFAIWTARSPGRSRIDRLLGDASYTVYLAHWPVIAFYFSGTIGPIAAWAGSLLAGALLLVVERPFEAGREAFLQRLRDRSRSAAAGATAPP